MSAATVHVHHGCVLDEAMRPVIRFEMSNSSHPGLRPAIATFCSLHRQSTHTLAIPKSQLFARCVCTSLAKGSFELEVLRSPAACGPLCQPESGNGNMANPMGTWRSSSCTEKRHLRITSPPHRAFSDLGIYPLTVPRQGWRGVQELPVPPPHGSTLA